MALVINTNISALTAQRNLSRAQTGLEKSIQRLSTGMRINNAADDAAGLAISDRLSAQVRGLNQAVRNANDGVSALQTADGSLSAVSGLLQRARELAVQSANDSNSASDRSSLNAEVSNILSELDRLANTVQFNNRKLLDGSFENAQFQIGANAYQTVSFSIASVQASNLGAITRAGSSVSSTALSDLTAASSMTINGIAVTIGEQDSIEGVIGAVNERAGDTGATAVKNNQTIVTDSAFTGLTGGDGTTTLTLNGVTITLTTGNAYDDASFVARVNDFSNQTGVLAKVAGTAGTSITFTRASGGDITLLETSTGGSAVGDTVAGTAARTFNAGFTLSVDLGASLTVGTAASEEVLGQTTASTNVENRVNNVSILTVTGANSSIETIDFALSQLARVRGDIGAVQNRFISAIGSLQVASENLSAARSRIMDADVAQETAELTRNQILIQAGVAVLAQANQLPSVALSLLGK